MTSGKIWFPEGPKQEKQKKKVWWRNMTKIKITSGKYGVQ